MRLESLTPEDAAVVVDIMSKIKSPGAPHWNLDQVRSEITSGESLALKEGAKTEPRVEAFILFKRVGPELFEITYLASQKKRAGLMTELFQKFLEHTQANEVWLEVHEQNLAAIAFYEKCGFQEVGRRPSYYADQGAARLFSLKNKLAKIDRFC